MTVNRDTKFAVTPPQAYLLGHGELLAGRLHPLCWSCKENITWYSEAGFRESRISGLCEPCFDFINWPSDEVRPAWMSFVVYKKTVNKEGST